MSAGGKLNDDREADLLKEIVNVSSIARDESLRRVDAGLREDLLRTELVAGTSDRNRARGSPVALHFKLANDGATVASHTVRNARNNRIIAGENLAAIVNIRVFLVERHVAVFVFDNFDLVAAFFSFFD